MIKYNTMGNDGKPMHGHQSLYWNRHLFSETEGIHRTGCSYKYILLHSNFPSTEIGEADLAVPCIYVYGVYTQPWNTAECKLASPTYTCQLKGLYARSKANKWTHSTQVGCAESGWGVLGGLRAALRIGVQSQSTYICRVQSCVWRLPKYWPPTPLSTQRVCPPPAPKAGGTHSRGGKGVGGQYFGRRQT